MRRRGEQGQLSEGDVVLLDGFRFDGGRYGVSIPIFVRTDCKRGAITSRNGVLSGV